MSKDFFDKLREERVNSHNKIKKIKHEIYISRNKVSLRGIWAWFFIGLFIIDIINLILWAISALLKMIILYI